MFLRGAPKILRISKVKSLMFLRSQIWEIFHGTGVFVRPSAGWWFGSVVCRTQLKSTGALTSRVDFSKLREPISKKKLEQAFIGLFRFQFLERSDHSRKNTGRFISSTPPSGMTSNIRLHIAILFLMGNSVQPYIVSLLDIFVGARMSLL